MRLHKKMLLYICMWLLLFSSLLHSCSPTTNTLTPRITVSTTTASQGGITAKTEDLPYKTTETKALIHSSSESTQTLQLATPTREGEETTSQPSLVNLLGNPLISLTDTNDSTVFLVDLATGYKRPLKPKGADISTVYEWQENGCELNIGLMDGRIVRVDLQGNIVQVLYDVGDQGNRATYSYAISPTDKWIAYLVGYGYHDYASYEFQDIEITEIKGQKKSRLTIDGGVKRYSWSPDGLRLAYSSKDSTGIQQLFVSEPEGNNRIQLTQFTDLETEIGPPFWSPDGSKIAFILQTPNKGDSLFIVSLNDNMQIKKYDVSGGSIWWHDPITIGLTGYYKEPGTIVWTGGIKWIDINTGELRYFVSESDLPGDHVLLAKPFDDTGRIGFFGDKNIFYIYDPNEQTLNAQPSFDSDLLIKDWTPAPRTFPGEANCAP